MWEYNGQRRPPFAEEPGPGQESVWDYPRPPALVESDALIEVFVDHVPIASSRSASRLLETASPPTFYLPAADINWRALVEIDQRSYCEWKGEASYWALAGQPDTAVAWHYAQPAAAYSGLRDHASFYPGRVQCFVDGERVRPQAGGFYGGWITRELVGPFKGDPGTGHW